jgi:single-strand DNA-binding protein
MNKVIIMGNLGQDPEMRYMPSGSAVANISVATSRSWKDKDSGEKKEETSWHRCVAFGRTAETIGEYFKKGRKILIEGRLQYGSYEKDGIKRYTTDIVIDRFEFVEKREGGGQRQERDQDGQQPASRAAAEEQEPAGEPDFDDDIPFMLPHPA